MRFECRAEKKKKNGEVSGDMVKKVLTCVTLELLFIIFLFYFFKQGHTLQSGWPGTQLYKPGWS